MHSLLEQLNQLIHLLQQQFHVVIYFLLLIWVVHIINFTLGYRLNIFGIYPRSLPGLLGIAFAPFLHGNFNHLFFNSIALLPLAALVLLNGLLVFITVSIVIIIFSGAAVWLVGRKAIHIGASSLIMGYWSFLLILVFKEPSILTIILAFVSLYYFGGLFLYIIPSNKSNESWEGHLFGFIAGIIAIYSLPMILPVIAQSHLLTIS